MHARVVANVVAEKSWQAISECVNREARLHTERASGLVPAGKE